MAVIRTSRLVVLMAVIAGFGLIGGTFAGWTGRIMAPVAVRLRSTVHFIQQYVSRGDLIAERNRLADELAQAQAALAGQDDLRRENDALRAAVGLHERVHRDLIMGAVFSYVSDGVSRHLVVNRGSRDQVAQGDIVVTAQSEVVGVVSDIFSDHAMVRALGDPNGEITSRILDTDISGLVKNDAVQGLIMDLIQKGEAVTEGQTVVTSGNDQFPAGLIIGTVRSVDSTSASLFQIVRISPAIDMTFSGTVFMMHP